MNGTASSAPKLKNTDETWSMSGFRSLMKASAAGWAWPTVSGVNIDGEPSISIITSSGVVRPVHGGPSDDAQV